MHAIDVQNLSLHFTLSKKRERNKQKNTSRDITESGRIVNGKLKAVDQINFQVKRGEIFGLLGPNGAGKTTTIRMLTGILHPTEGKITVFNKELQKNRIMVQQIMGHVPEMSNVYLDLTGMQNLVLIGELYGVPRQERQSRAEKLLKKFELFNRKDSKAKKYSKGMRQRLLLCMALMSDPAILFLDEPTSGLDVQSSVIIKDLIREYHATGMTIILTTHDMEVANELCDRIAIMCNGKIISLDTPENLKELKQQYQAIDIYLEEEVNIEALESLQNVKEVQKKEDYYHIIIHDLDEAISEVVEFTKANHLNLKKLNTYEPHLREIFLKLIDGDETHDGC